MAKNDGVLGISVNHGRLTLTLIKADQIKQTVWDEAPDNIVEGTKIISQKLFADLLQEKIKENGIKCKKAAYVIADADVFIRNISMPKMSDEQLKYNIPYEFHDYIQGEMNSYAYDYVKREKSEEMDDQKMELLAYAVPIKLIEDIRETLKLAGLKLEKAIPETVAYEALLHTIEDEEEMKKERCFLDIGRRGIRMMIFKNGIYKLAHPIDIGENHAIQAIADDLNIDQHLAVTYLRTNYEDCDKSQAAMNAFKDISIEIMKGLNFYEMSDFTSRLNDVVLCGTGAFTEPLVDILKKRIDKNVLTMDEFFPKYSKEKEINVTYGSVGILLTEDSVIGSVGNLAGQNAGKNVKPVTLICYCAAAALVIGLFGKFAIYDRINALRKEYDNIALLEEQIEAQKKLIEGSEDLIKDYAHYTWEGMTEEEKSRVSRLDTAKLADFVKSQQMKVESMSLTKSVLTMKINARNLESVSKLIENLQKEEIVESCSVVSAKTNEKDITEVYENKSADGENTEITTQIIEEDSSVDATINIYLASKNAVEDEESAQ